jgi:hypothetical protein
MVDLFVCLVGPECHLYPLLQFPPPAMTASPVTEAANPALAVVLV